MPCSPGLHFRHRSTARSSRAWRAGALASSARCRWVITLRNLKVRWHTTLLTALAFMLVIGLMIVMLAFVNGMSRLTEHSGQPGNVMVLSDGAIDELFSNLKYSDTSDVERQPGVLRDATTSRCAAAKPIWSSTRTGRLGRRPARTALHAGAGIEDPVMSAQAARHAICIPAGQWFSEAGRKVCPVTASERRRSDSGRASAKASPARWGAIAARKRSRWAMCSSLAAASGLSWASCKSEGSTFGSEIWAKWSLVRQDVRQRTATRRSSCAPPTTSGQALADDLTKNFKKIGTPGHAGNGVFLASFE